MKACQDHPNIVKLYDVFKDERYTYIVMELLTGGELFERIKECRRFTEKEAMIFFRQIVRAVFCMHKANVAHRDLKPENILFVRKNSTTLKIVDFGFAKQDFDQGMATPCFTLDYAAPEVLESRSSARNYTEASDLWSLGVILYTMLCGQTPFQPKRQIQKQSDRIKSIMDRIRSGSIEMETAEWNNVSETGRDLVRGLLDVDSRSRLTMAQLLNHEWFQQNKQRDLRQPLIAPKEGAECCVKDTCHAYQFCLKDGFTGSLGQRRRRKSSEDEQDARKMSEESETLGRSKSSSGIVTSDFNRSISDTNSDDVEIVAEFNAKPQFKLNKSVLGDALLEANSNKREVEDVGELVGVEKEKPKPTANDRNSFIINISDESRDYYQPATELREELVEDKLEVETDICKNEPMMNHHIQADVADRVYTLCPNVIGFSEQEIIIEKGSARIKNCYLNFPIIQGFDEEEILWAKSYHESRARRVTESMVNNRTDEKKVVKTNQSSERPKRQTKRTEYEVPAETTVRMTRARKRRQELDGEEFNITKDVPEMPFKPKTLGTKKRRK